MSESLLKALMQIFALLTDFNQEEKSGKARLLVKDYLHRHFNIVYAEEYLLLFYKYLKQYHEANLSNNQQAIEIQSAKNQQKIIEICESLNKEMEREPKVLLFVQLLEFLKKEDEIGGQENYLIDMLAKHMLIDNDDYKNIKTFILNYPSEIKDKDTLLIISGNVEDQEKGYKFIHNEKQQTTVWVLRVKSTETFIFRYDGDRNLYLNGQAIAQNRTYVLAPGGAIKTSLIPPVYYGRVAELFLDIQRESRIIYRALDVEYKFNPNQTAIHKFSFLGRSGQLIGVIGGSGTGKSTLLNVLNGNLKLNHGRITINGYDLHKDKEHLKGIIGYVPQVDLLIEELTVYENLYYNARLCFSKQSKKNIDKIVNHTLIDFDLVEAENLVVGSPLKKILSGGQRKRLNIALELMRQPSILFVDEPTSGLSSMDSEKVMSLLKRQTLKGKLVIINIHQPSSDLFKLFDKLLIIDKGGRIIHNGNPMDSIEYFKRAAHYVNPEERECLTCGNVKTEQPLRIIESRMVNPDGRLIRERKVQPQEWYTLYQKNFEDRFLWKKNKSLDRKEKLPPNLFSIPNRWDQFKIFFSRDALSKLKDQQYLSINFLEAPVLALILGFFTKYIVNPQTEGYIFSENVNIPAYLFMSVVVSLFLGLNVSAEEIIKDRKLLQRESFLNLSRSSYLNSKVIILFLISAIQTLSFVLVGNAILEIQGLTISYWLILFTVACFANMLGLNISSGLNSVVSIYILIPLILVPQMLFSGVIVEFDKLHTSISSHEKVPLIGDIMTSRWGYEALAVNQYKNNNYEKHFFEDDRMLSTYAYNSTLWIPELKMRNNEALWAKQHHDSSNFNLHIEVLNNELPKLRKQNLNIPIATLSTKNYDENSHKSIDSSLTEYKQYFTKKYKEYSLNKDEEFIILAEQLGSTEKLRTLKKENYNKTLANWVMQKKEKTQILFVNNQYIRKKQPIYQAPSCKNGRAQFYAPYKQIGPIKINTPLFNMLVTIVFITVLYITLYFDVLRSVINYFDRFKLRRQTNRLMKITT